MVADKETTYTEETDSMGGKNLALHEKIKKEIKEAPKDNEGDILINPAVEIGGTLFELNIEKDPKEQSYKIHILGAHILTLDKNNELSFADGWKETLKDKIRNYPDRINEEAVIKNLEEMEESLQIDKEQQERQEEQKDEEDLSDDMEEKEDPEKEEPEKEDGDEVKQPVNEKKQKINLSSAVEVKSDREVNEDKTFAGLMKKEFDEAEEAERFFLVQNPNDANDYNLYATDNQGNVIDEIPLEHTEGKNPMDEDITVPGKDGKNVETQQAVQILKIGNSPSSAMLVVTKGTRTGTEVLIGNRSMGDDYQAHKVSSATRQRDNMDANEFVRRETSHTLAERNEGSAEKKYYETLERLDKQGVPEEANPAKDGISVGEIEVDSIDELSASLAAIFAKEYGLSKECAMNVATGLIEEGKKFDDALETGFEIEEKAGRIAPGSAEKRAEQAINYSSSGPERDEEEPQKLPGQGPRSGN